MEIALVAVWRLVRRADDPAASPAVVEAITRERDRLRDDVARRNDAMARAETTIQERDKRIAAVEEDRVRERREARETAAQIQTPLTEARAEATGLEEAHEARTRELETIRKTLEERFNGVALAALKTSNDEFRKQAEARFRQERAQADERFQRQRELAAQDLEARRTAVDNLVKPLGENLTKLDRKVAELERARAGAYERVHEAVSQARREIVQLRSETSQLHRALRSTRERGDWGEQQLRRVVEAAGMMEHVEFTEQAVLGTDRRRPDLIVTLPGDKRIVVDAKTPMDAFETEDVHQQQAHFRRHAEALTTRAKELAQRDYTGGVPGAFDFAVMFVPHDAILDAAERAKTGVWDQAWRQHRVLIALLRTIAIGWQQANAKAIADAACTASTSAAWARRCIGRSNPTTAVSVRSNRACWFGRAGSKTSARPAENGSPLSTRSNWTCGPWRRPNSRPATTTGETPDPGGTCSEAVRSAEQLDQCDRQPDDAGRHEPQLPIQPHLQIAEFGPDQTDVGLQFRPDVGDLGLPLDNLGSERSPGFAECLHGAVGVEGERIHGPHCVAGRADSSTAEGSGAVRFESAVGRFPRPRPLIVAHLIIPQAQGLGRELGEGRPPAGRTLEGGMDVGNRVEVRELFDPIPYGNLTSPDGAALSLSNL